MEKAMTTREFLEEATLSRELVDRFLDPDAFNWAVFDPELGYRLRDCMVQDGVDGCYTIAHYPLSGARKMVNYADVPCRINTYGDSFTQCHQVSDGETWQEYLAAHFGEPIRNFGVGGYGVYQAYRRMLREEATDAAAEYVILNIWSDDHYRSVMTWRWMHMPEFRRHMLGKGLSDTEACMFHANPWTHVRLDLTSGAFEECENPYPTPESLYMLCDPDYVHDTFRNDWVVQTMLGQHGGRDVQTDMLDGIADVLNVPMDYSSPDTTVRSAHALMTAYALGSSMYIVEKARAFAETNGKKLLLFLSYDENSVRRACRGITRFDQPFLDYVNEHDYLFVDTLKAHADEFALFGGDPEAYVQRYYIGHYNPQGNHFFAFAVKNTLVDWLCPKPPTYM